MTREQGRFLLERSCFLLGCSRIGTEGRCALESFYIFLEWKQQDLGVVKSGKTGIISLVRCKADMIKNNWLADANRIGKDVSCHEKTSVNDDPRVVASDRFRPVAFCRRDGA